MPHRNKTLDVTGQSKNTSYLKDYLEELLRITKHFSKTQHLFGEGDFLELHFLYLSHNGDTAFLI